MAHEPAARSVPAFDLARAWVEPPAVASPLVLRWTNALFWLIGGLVVLVGAAWLGDDGVHRTGVAALGTGALVVGLVIVLAGSRLARRGYWALSLLGTTLITAAVLLGGGGTASLALSVPYLLVMVNAAFMFSLRAGLVHVVLAQVAATVSLALSGVGAGDILIAAGSQVGTAGVVAWLARVANAAEEDPLTSLLNRRGLDRKLDEAMRVAAREGGQLSLALLDVDDFKSVNAQRGHLGGDRLLVDFAEALRTRVPETMCLSRYGGDEFALLMPGVPLGRAADIADELRAVAPDRMTMSAGVAALEQGDSGSMLLSRADVALYDAKTAGRDQTVVYGDPERSSSELEAAISDGQMRLYLQPVVQLSTEEVVGFEALVRWQHPTRGLVPPGEFVPHAERTGAVRSLGKWMLQEICRVVMTAPPPRRSVGLNASVRELQDPDYADMVRRELERWSMPGNLLVVEVTESAFGGDDPRVDANLRRLRELGVLVAIDDFGAGYSSLRRLETFPIDIIKVDGALVSSIRSEASEAPILRAVVTIGRALDVRLVAEWVEDEHQATVLRRLGYDLAQGYLFGKAEPAEELLSRRTV